MKIILVTLLCSAHLLGAAEQIPNEQINYPGFVQIAGKAAPIREKRRVTEAEFLTLAAEPGAIVLDARSADKFALRHVQGAVSLPFTDFTAETLARTIPTKATRVLIYCNNNFRGSPAAFASKSPAASLNISTYIALTTYGYTNVYELGLVIEVTKSKLPFAGSEVTK